MRTPAQAFRDAITSGAVEAWSRGEKIQTDTANSTTWTFWTGSSDVVPRFADPEFVWRPAPTKRRIPFTQLTIPKGALWRFKDSNRWFAPIEYCANGITYNGTQYAEYDDHLMKCEYSTDGGATWQPGSQEVES